MRISPGSSAEDGAASPVPAALVSAPVADGGLGGAIAAVVVLPVPEAGAGGAMPPEAPVLDPLLPPLVAEPLLPEPVLPSGGGGGGGVMPPPLPPPAVAVEAVCVELPLAPEAGAAVLPPRTEGGGGAIEGAVGGGEGGGGGVGVLVSELVAAPLSEVEGAAGAVWAPVVEAVSVELGAAGAVLSDAIAGAWLGCAAARGT